MTSRTQIKSSILAVLVTCSVLLIDASARAGGAPGSIDRRLVARAEAVTRDAFPFSTATPRGVRVLARAKPRPEVLGAIDDVFTELFAIARRHGYRARLSHSDYTVFIARADRTKDSSCAYSPDIALSAAQYARSV